MKPTWMILGATSAIAKEFSHLAAKNGYPLMLVGRDTEQLEIMASDIRLRFSVPCEIIYCDFALDIKQLMSILLSKSQDFSLFIALSSIVDNKHLTPKTIEILLTTNILSITQITHGYLQKKQAEHRLIYLSSVAACKGRAKNSLYGGSKAAIEIYLQGLQQSATKSQSITIAQLGFIDTIQTFGQPGIFYASPPKACAKACWRASYANKRQIYHPFFWRYIMVIITHLPFFIYRRITS